MTRNPIPVVTNPKDSYVHYKLREARRRAGYITASRFAEVLGVNPLTVRGWEAMINVPDDKMKQRIAETLGRSIDDLFPDNFKDIASEINAERRNSFNEERYKPLHKLSEDELPIDTTENGRALTEIDTREFLCRILNNALRVLPATQRDVIRLRYGLVDGVPKKFEEIAEIYGFSYQYACQLEKAALERLREVSYLANALQEVY